MYNNFARVYDRLMEDMPYGDWLSWLEEYWARYGQPQTLVDLGCGTGTMTIPLAAKGLQVVGIDLSDEMLQCARNKEKMLRKAEFIPRLLDWQQQDMRRWSLPQQVECVISCFDCLNYLLSEADLLQTFQQTYAGLVRGGMFLFDMHHRNQFDDYAMNAPFCLDDDEVSYIWNCSWNKGQEILEHRLSLFIREQDRFMRVVETHHERVYTEQTVILLLEQAGFTRIESYADFSFASVDEAQTHRLFFAAWKDA
jgi:SAM-dependent methyltransferase